MINLCVSFGNDFNKLLKELNLWETKDIQAELECCLELLYFATSILIAAYHGDNRSLPILYGYMLNNTMAQHDKRILSFMSNINRFIDKSCMGIRPKEFGNEIYYSGVISGFGVYSKTIQKDYVTRNLRYTNTLNRLIDCYITYGISNKNENIIKFGEFNICIYDEKLSKENRDKLIEPLYDLFMQFYQSCGEIFYPINAMLKLYPLT